MDRYPCKEIKLTKVPFSKVELSLSMVHRTLASTIFTCLWAQRFRQADQLKKNIVFLAIIGVWHGLLVFFLLRIWNERGLQIPCGNRSIGRCSGRSILASCWWRRRINFPSSMTARALKPLNTCSPPRDLAIQQSASWWLGKPWSQISSER